jgi:hypothetical protein
MHATAEINRHGGRKRLLRYAVARRRLRVMKSTTNRPTRSASLFPEVEIVTARLDNPLAKWWLEPKPVAKEVQS